ncbi:hypothetical protein ACWZHB_01185 [Nocardia sp. FBN12]|uniref:hypothetical protein n=1 Tax=Nocardia sp. FBN12 TaxID=3419766 RepID=UPI003D03E417
MRELIETRENGTRIYIEHDDSCDSPYDNGDYMYMSAVIHHGHGRYDLYESKDDEIPVTATKVREALHRTDYRIVVRWLEVVYGLRVDGDGGSVLFFTRGDAEDLSNDMAIFNAWRDGECGGWIVEDPDEVEVESVWGFYMTDAERDYMLYEARIAADRWTPDPAAAYRRMNEAAKLHPAGDGYPAALEVGGVLVLAYVDQQGTLRVSIDLDTVDSAITSTHETVPMQIAVQGEQVFAAA